MIRITEENQESLRRAFDLNQPAGSLVDRMLDFFRVNERGRERLVHKLGQGVLDVFTFTDEGEVFYPPFDCPGEETLELPPVEALAALYVDGLATAELENGPYFGVNPNDMITEEHVLVGVGINKLTEHVQQIRGDNAEA